MKHHAPPPPPPPQYSGTRTCKVGFMSSRRAWALRLSSSMSVKCVLASCNGKAQAKETINFRGFTSSFIEGKLKAKVHRHSIPLQATQDEERAGCFKFQNFFGFGTHLRTPTRDLEPQAPKSTSLTSKSPNQGQVTSSIFRFPSLQEVAKSCERDLNLEQAPDCLPGIAVFKHLRHRNM